MQHVDCRSGRGSSPLTRGKPLEGLAGLLSRRLIPAHAGKTSLVVSIGSCAEAHPRSRGENLVAAVDTMPDTGSSPLTRGKPVRSPRPLFRGRLIPAHAGKTPQRRRRLWCLAAHPRSRGENAPTPTAAVVPSGSSPLTRGKPATVTAMAGALGLIPAHAGKTN